MAKHFVLAIYQLCLTLAALIHAQDQCNQVWSLVSSSTLPLILWINILIIIYTFYFLFSSLTMQYLFFRLH